MNRLEIEKKILFSSQKLPENALLELLHYVKFLEQKNALQQIKQPKRFGSA